MQQKRQALLALAVMGMGSFALAADVQTPAVAPANGEAVDNGVRYTAVAGASYQFDTDFDDVDDASFAVTRVGGAVGLKHAMNDNLTFGHGLLVEHSAYDFDFDATDTAPWNSVNTVGYALKMDYEIDEEWSVFAGPVVGASVANGADFNDGLYGGAMVGGQWNISPDTTVGLGVVVIGGLGDDARVAPIIILDAKLTEELSLKNTKNLPGVPGAVGVELVWQATDQLDCGLGAALESRRFRLDDEGAVDDLIGQDTSMPVYVRVGYTLDDNWTITGMAGVSVGGEIEVENDEGDNFIEEDYDPAPFVGVAISWKN